MKAHIFEDWILHFVSISCLNKTAAVVLCHVLSRSTAVWSATLWQRLQPNIQALFLCT